MEENKRKRGRPKKEGSLHNEFKMRMDDDMTMRLANLSELTGMSRADIIREAFTSYERLKMFQYTYRENTDAYNNSYDDIYDEDYIEYDENGEYEDDF